MTEDVQRSDGELIAAVGVGGSVAAAAWQQLVGRHSPRLFAVARSFDLDAATAEDLVQTAWLRLLERAEQLRDHDTIGPWLCAIVRNEARRIVVRRREIPTVLDLELRPDPSGDVDARTLEDEQASAVRIAFRRLGEECRQLLRLSLAEPPLSYDEIAAAIGRPRGSLGPTRRRCLEQLRLRLPVGFEP
jgi:RNA polymerase sigma factor (sigma-70 family)